jgi:transposase
MHFTQNQKIEQVTDETLVVGVDIGSETHYARAFNWRGIEQAKVFSFSNNAEGFSAFHNWVQTIKSKSNKIKVMVGAEPTGHYWFTLAAYLKVQQMQLVFVNPYHVKQTKELVDNNQK